MMVDLVLHVDGHVTSTQGVRATVYQVKTQLVQLCSYKEEETTLPVFSLLFRLMEKLDFIAADSSP